MPTNEKQLPPLPRRPPLPRAAASPPEQSSGGRFCDPSSVTESSGYKDLEKENSKLHFLVKNQCDLIEQLKDRVADTEGTFQWLQNENERLRTSNRSLQDRIK